MPVDPSDYYNIINGTSYVQCPLTDDPESEIECNPTDGLDDQIWYVGTDITNTILQCTFSTNGTNYYIKADGIDDGKAKRTSRLDEATSFYIHPDGAIELLGITGDDKFYLCQENAKAKVKKNNKQTWTWNKTQLGSSGHT